MAMPLWPPISWNGMSNLTMQLTNTFPSLSPTYSSQQLGRQAQWGLLKLPILQVEDRGSGPHHPVRE